MKIDLLIRLLKLIKEGSIIVNENHHKSAKIVFHDNKVTIDLLDVKLNVPLSNGLFSNLRTARDFAKKLQKHNMTLCISHKGKNVIKLGKKANPKLSYLLTQSKAVEITDLRELRRLERQLRLDSLQ